MLEELKGFCKKYKMENLFSSAYSIDMWFKACHINFMTTIAMKLAEGDDNINPELLRICCLHHDDGSALQYKQYGEFNDNKVSHYALGLDMLDHYLMAHKISVTPQIHILRACIYYHNRIELAGNSLDEETKKYVQLVSDANEIEKKCLAPAGYLDHKIANDKFYHRRPNSQADKQIRPEVFEAYENGGWTQEFFGCNSSAEEILFEATIAIECIKKYGDIAKWAMRNINCYTYSSAFTGYTQLFRRYLSRADAERAISIMEKALN